MNKAEALVVLHEIRDVLKESVIISSLSLDCTPQVEHMSKLFYEIKMKCELDSQSREYLQLVLDRHKLSMKVEKGSVTICKHLS
jgi:hypothetical protein